ncbi:GumC family protein [Thalassovita sp.]|uniref:GumC family protein n=1 Tax=Thalassovita sp. TaxID=1979401 RepID=UPI002AB02B93|nr:Wzz/FepE/Etk N-terminal domain-containing protein [Thalassovita sp.]
MHRSHAAFLDLRDILHILRRQRWLVTLTCLVILTLAGAYLLRTTALFTATALVQIDPQETNLLDPSAGHSGTLGAEDVRIETEVEILKSPRLALQTIKTADLSDTAAFGPRVGLLDQMRLALGVTLPTPSATALVNETIANFSEALTVQRRGQTYLVSVQITSEDPDLAAHLANTHARIYIGDQLTSRRRSVAASGEVLRAELGKSAERLAESNAALRGYVLENIDRLSAEVGSAELRQLSIQLTDGQAQLLRVEDRLQLADQGLEQGDWQDLAAQVGDQSLAALAQQRTALATRLIGAELTPQDSFDLTAEVRALEAELRAQGRAAVTGLRRDYQQVQRAQDRTLGEVQRALTSADLSPQTLTDIYALNQNALTSQRQFDRLNTRLRDVEALAVMQVAGSRLVSEALPPSDPSFPNTGLVLGVALVFALGMGIGLALLKEFYYGGVTSASQLGNVLPLKTAAAVPKTAMQPGWRTLADKVVAEPMTQFAEAFRALRASVDRGLGTRGQASGAVVLVTSANPAEGKSTTALALARTYALAGQRTLLIDADLRSPNIQAFIGAEPNVGLLEYLQSNGALRQKQAGAGRDDNDAPVEQFYLRDPRSPLAIILGSRRADVPTDAPLQSTAFKALLDNARGAFDVVIVDSAPLAPLVDTQYIAPLVDVAVLCVRFGQATQVELRSAYTSLRETLPEDAAIIGILNGVEGRSQGYSYGSYFD